MQLVRLSANKKSFKTVEFRNKTGLNFIVADLKNSKHSKKGDSSNGVGKSLLITIMHFCLGSNKNIEFQEKLPGWVFSLIVIIKNKEYSIKRSTDNQNIFILNEKEVGTKVFRLTMQNILFDIPDEVSHLTFRSLLPFFIRPRKASYTDFSNANAVKNNYQILVTNAFLLGLDVVLAEKKYQLRIEKERVRKLIKELSTDRLLKDFFLGNKDFTLASQDLEEKINELEHDLMNFTVAEDYYDIKSEANSIKIELDKISNQIILFSNQVKNIEESRKFSPDIKKEHIERIYNESSVILNKNIIKKLEELENFYEHISINRKKRLLDQKNVLLRDIEKLTLQKEAKSIGLDEKLKYLDTHQALDIFVKLTNQLSDLKNKKENYTKYHDLIESYRKEMLIIDENLIKETQMTATYLDESEATVKSLMLFFRGLSKRFYPNSSSGITINNNDGDNQIRYDIDAKIEADSSDGINSVKIFNYDLTILLKGFAHHLNFIFHDSRLLDGIDPRQKAELFLILNENIKVNGKQYILTLNQNQLDDTKKYLDPNDYKTIVEDNIILTLKDHSPEDKLLGIQVDMDYE